MEGMKLRHFSSTPLVSWKNWGEEEGYVHDGFGPLMQVQEEDYVHDGSGDTLEVQEGDRVDCSGDRTESGQVYIY